MSLYDAALVAAADTQNIQGGGNGFLSELGNALTAGAAGAVISGLGSIYNTAAAGANALGANVEEIDTYKKLAELDTNWANYYRENQNAIDVVGFIGTSILPGGLAIKGLNAVRAGNASNVFGRSLGFARTKQAEAVSAALAELAVEGGTVFTRINKSKMAAMGWGFADQTLTAAAFEIGVAATMKQSPLLADDSWWDIGKTALLGAAFGGVIGGGIDSIILHRGFKDTVKGLDLKQRKYDYSAAYDRFNLQAGDKAYGVVDSLLRLPKDVESMDGFLKLPEVIANRNTGKSKVLNVSSYLGNVLKGAEGKGLLDFELALKSISTDNEVAAGVAELLLTWYAKLKTSGTSNAHIREDLGDLLHELKHARPATEKVPPKVENLFYFSKTVDHTQLKTLDDWKKMFSRTPTGNDAYSKPYQFLGSSEDFKTVFGDAAFIGREGQGGYATLKAAWEDGKHVAFLPDGAVRVNDRSRYWLRVDDTVFDGTRFLNTKTGAVTHDAILTAADRVPAGQRLVEGIGIDGVTVASKAGKDAKTKFISMRHFNKQGDVEYFTARHAWAAKLKDSQLPDTIDGTDFSLMDRLSTVTEKGVLERIKILSDGEELGLASELTIPAAIKSAKLSTAQEAFADAYMRGDTLDIRELAYKLNTDVKWLEQTVATRFRDSLSGELLINDKTVRNFDGLSRPLTDYLRRENVLAEFGRPEQFKELTGIGEHVKMSWRDKRLIIMDQVAMTGGQFVTGELAWMYRVQAAIAATKNAAAATLGTERAGRLIDLAQDVAKLADSVGVGSSFFGSSNANYGDILKLAVQDIGKNVHHWINEDVTKMVGAFSTIATKLRGDPTASAEVGIITNMIRASGEKYVWGPAGGMMLRELKGLTGVAREDAIAAARAAGRDAFIPVESALTREFFKTHAALNAERVGKRKVLVNARGLTSDLDEETIYVPPINTTYFKHFAFVRPVEGKAFGTSEVSMVFGRDAAELSRRAAAVDKTNFEVVTKDQTEKWFKAKELYDFDLTINEPRINSELKKSGALNNMFPEVRGESLIEDYLGWHQNQISRLVRDSVETNYAQQFAELKKLGENYVEMATSRFAGTLRTSKSEVVNPYADYVKTALDISKRSEYTFFHQANEFVDALGTRAYQAVQSVFGDAKAGVVTWQEANRIAERHGVKGMYSNEADFFVSNVPRDKSLVKEYVAKANMLLANVVLRLDFANSLINIVSTPLTLGTEMASIRSLMKNDPVLLGKLADLTSVMAPGTDIAVPSTGKLMANAVKNFFGKDKDELITRYRANGDVKDIAAQYHSMLDNLALRPDFKMFKEGTDKAFEKAATLTGNNWAEDFTRFVSADVMRQLSDPLVEAGKLTLKEQNAYISTFVNRVHGNYISSQRPIVFQGVLGSAVSLFQTYSFNLMQQLLRHVENRDARAVATLFGLQAGLFGLNGTPLFEAVNTHLIGNAAVNDGHYDAYSLAPAILGKEVGDWLMYGTVSAFPAFGDKWPSLYTRGDINPRHISILPMTPTAVPAVDASIRVVRNLADVGRKLIGGADISTTILQGMEHNGVSRPLAGFAQVLAGRATTSKGGLISASNDFNLIMTAARIAGSKPMDESLALNAMYRNKAYQAADRDRMEILGEKVKTYLYNDQFPPDDIMDGFMKDYASAGGRAENFNRAMQAWMKDANTSTVEKMRTKMNSSYGQRLNEIMGGEPLNDYQNQQGQSEMLLPE